MKRINLLMAAVISIGITSQSFAQKGKKDDPKHTNYFLDVEEAIETREVVMEFSNGVSRMDFLKFKTKFTNNTNDFLLIDPSKFTITVNGTETHPKEKQFILDPNENTSKTIDVKEGANFNVDQLEVVLDSAFSRASVKGKPTGAGEFKMKPDKNSIMMEPFAVTLKKWRFDPKELSADFKIRYRGEGIGIVNESKIRIRREDGTVLKNTDAKDKLMVIPPMATKTLTVVRPFDKGEIGKGESVYVVWDEALQESDSKPIKV